MSPGRVLIVGDKAERSAALCSFLEDLPIEVQVAEGPASAIQLLERRQFQAVLCDLVVPNGRGNEVLRFIRRLGLHTPVIVMVGCEEQGAQECPASGAFELVPRPAERSTLLAALRRALLRSRLIFGEHGPHPASHPPLKFPGLVGNSTAMGEILRQVAKMAEADANVCIYGESGTGKELAARAIHSSSRRAGHPLIVLDCAAIPEGLMESELFGHVKGSFTSAMTEREGLLQLADGGTLLLDEVGELPLPLQAKLLRVIEGREFRKVGGQQPIQVNVRFIAITNKDLRAMVGEGTFRKDLLYRLEVIPFTLPPLRDRKEDIPLLVEHFIEQFNRNRQRQIRGVSCRTMEMLLRYHWPGNIRELENCIERAVVMADEDLLDVSSLAPLLSPVGAATPSPAPMAGVPLRTLKEAERDLVLKTLQGVRGNQTQAAALLGISLRGLVYKLGQLRRGAVLPSGGNGAVNGRRPLCA